MTAEQHIVTWIESSQPEYMRLLEIYRRRQPGCTEGFMRASGIATAALNLATAAYSQMIAGGDAYTSDHSATSILRAAILIAEWELEA